MAGPSAPAAEADGPQSQSFTRLCVKNVPKHVDEKRLREHFAAQGGQVTDAKLLRTKAGQPRKMAFVGFRSEAEARAALRYFHGTFLDTSRLVVEAALPRGATALPRPWSRHSQGSSRFEAAQQKGQGQEGGAAKKRGRAAGTGDDDSGGEKDEKQQQQQQQKQRRVGKEEYLATMMPRSRTQFWANDDAGGVAAVGGDDNEAADDKGNGEGKGKGKGKGKGPVDSGGSEDEDSEGEDEAAAAASSSGSEEDAMDEQDESDDASASSSSSLQEPEPAAAGSGLDFLRSKVKKGLEREIDGKADGGVPGPGPAAGAVAAAKKAAEEEGDESGSSDDDEEEEEEEEEEEDPQEQPRTPDPDAAAPAPAGDAEAGASVPRVEETGRLFIRNLPFSATEEDVTAALEAFGQLSEVHMPLDDSKRPKGFAFATFVLPEDAGRALDAMDGQAFQGRLLHVLPAKEPPRDPLADLDPAKARTYKERKEIERRQRAGDEKGWNASFLRGRRWWTRWRTAWAWPRARCWTGRRGGWR